jgi:hypothetical protein
MLPNVTQNSCLSLQHLTVLSPDQVGIIVSTLQIRKQRPKVLSKITRICILCRGPNTRHISLCMASSASQHDYWLGPVYTPSPWWYFSAAWVAALLFCSHLLLERSVPFPDSGRLWACGSLARRIYQSLQNDNVQQDRASHLHFRVTGLSFFSLEQWPPLSFV